MSEFLFTEHKYGYDGKCIVCGKLYSPDPYDFCIGKDFDLEKPKPNPKCECGASHTSDPNFHSYWCPAYKKP